MEKDCATCVYYDTDRKDQPCCSCWDKINYEKMEAEEMENKKLYNDDVERIVNDPERQAVIDDRYYKRQMHRQRKMLTTALLYVFFAAAFGALGLVGWMLAWLAYPVCAACCVWSAFNFGRWFENGKCWGWH